MNTDDDSKQYARETPTAERPHGNTRVDVHPHAADQAFARNVHVLMPPPGKSSVHVRLHPDVLDRFRQQGRGHPSRMNASSPPSQMPTRPHPGSPHNRPSARRCETCRVLPPAKTNQFRRAGKRSASRQER